MQIIDIHSHLQFADFDNDRDQVIADMRDASVATIVVGTSVETSQLAIDLAGQHSDVAVGATVGHHPNEASEFNIETYRNILDQGLRSVLAVGECGLDYYRVARDQVFNDQSRIFRQQIELAIDNDLPLVLHGRPTANSMNAYQDMVKILSEYKDEWKISNPGNVHFFVGSTDIAKQFLELGYTISFDGPITFARDYDEVVRYIPSDMIHAETDSPYAAPVPHRGKPNQPLYVSHIIETLINIRQEASPEQFKSQLLDNAKRVFRF